MKTFLYELKEGLLISFRAIRSNKIRSILTTLGIVIGITSVVLMSTAINGINNAFQTGMASLGTDNLYIDKWAWFDNEKPWWELRNRKNITMNDYEQFKELAKLPLAVSPDTWTAQNVKYKNITAEAVIVRGTNHNYIKTSDLNFSEGRFFNELESNGGRNLAVLGSQIAKNLFKNTSPIGKEIKIKGHKFIVIGVLAEQGSWLMGEFNPDKQIFIPIQNIFKYFANENNKTITITVRAKNHQLLEQTKDEAVGIMRKIRGLKYYEEDDFSVNQQEGLIKNINQTVGVIQIAGLFITGLSLFVGAVGIMNIMFVSVKERTKEIGIRKAIGAKRRTILSQFITEAAIICLIGGLIGLFLAILLSKIVNQFLPTSVQIETIILAITISLITGVVSGFAPAYTAAKLDPVEALRYE
ncbi:ABC transporter permease [Rosettibacter firmus]|uniref:ABC transporter permease n=1 Tax=Rosettibacter firmus TaxID=3111522 RepID=UPI00336BF1A1